MANYLLENYKESLFIGTGSPGFGNGGSLGGIPGSGSTGGAGSGIGAGSPGSRIGGKVGVRLGLTIGTARLLQRLPFCAVKASKLATPMPAILRRSEPTPLNAV